MLRKALIGWSLACVFGAFAQEKVPRPVVLQTQKWGEMLGLSQAESVVFDGLNACFYVSNGKKFAPGTDGFISKFNLQGELEQLKWVDSLSRPAGMALYNNQLWVADVNQLKVIDISSGKQIKGYPEPVKNSGLNDVAISPEGEVFVTASFIHAVFKLEGDSLELWAQDKEHLQWANGIYATDREVLVGGSYLSSIDTKTREIRSIKTSPPIMDIDGLWPDGLGGYLLSTVEGNSLWHLDSDGKSTILSQGGEYFGDLQFVPKNATLYVPRGDPGQKRYHLAVFKLEGL